MISLIAEGNIIVLKNPELNDAEEAFWLHSVRYDYAGKPHSVSHKYRFTKDYTFKRVSSRNYNALKEFIADYAYCPITLIDWFGVAYDITILQNTLIGTSNSRCDEFDFTLKVGL